MTVEDYRDHYIEELKDTLKRVEKINFTSNQSVRNFLNKELGSIEDTMDFDYDQEYK